MQLPVWAPENALVHIGTLSPQDKGVRGDSYEGHGLSVSTCPEAWEAIAKLGGQPWWTLEANSSAGARFLDLLATPPESREEMVAWAVEKGLAVPCVGAKLSWHDADHDEMVFTTFDNPHSAQLEFEAMTEEHEGEPANAPVLESYEGWTLTPAGLAAVARTRADLDETPTMAAILYCESETDLDGVYWDNQLDVHGLSAPRAVIFPGRLPDFTVRVMLDDAGVNRLPALTPEDIYAHIVDAASSADAAKLAAAIARAPDSLALTDSHKDLDGTVHYYAIDRAVLMANSGQNFEAAVDHYIECTRVLRAAGAPVRHQFLDQGAEMSLLDSDWSTTGGAVQLTQLLRDSIAAGLVDPHKRLYHAHSTVGGLMPMSAAFKMGNSCAVQVLLEFGASLEDPLKDLDFEDIIECARSFGKPNSEAIAAMVTAKLMQEKLGADALTSHPGASLIAQTRARRRASL
jgi:hypothetical protein